MKIGKNNYKNPTNRGFTLVELSIVILIIGLLMAGIFNGQKLVNSAKLQTVIKEIREHDAAIGQFKDKFKYYPGDIPNAQTYWGVGTDNGDSNWQINGNEDMVFWSHLSFAKLVPGAYTKTTTRGTYNVNIPKSLYTGTASGYDVGYYSSYYGTSGNALEFGSLVNNSNNLLNGSVITPSDAYLIDKKIDDGQATSGNLYAIKGNGATGTSCVSADFGASSATYILTDNTVSCRLFWWLDKNN